MKSPFPGMDPYLEHPAIWPGVHQSMITYARDRLQAQLRGRYFVNIGERLFIETPDEALFPDVYVRRDPRHGPPTSGPELDHDRPVLIELAPSEYREVFLEILRARGDVVVTVIELLSPTNKRPGPGREKYLRKQEEVLRSSTSLVEVDLLRMGARTFAVPGDIEIPSPYAVVVGRATARTTREVYPVGLRDRLPRIGLPLLPEDRDAVLDLQAVFEEAYDKGAYGEQIDYGRPPPPPPLSPADEAWVKELLSKERVGP